MCSIVNPLKVILLFVLFYKVSALKGSVEIEPQTFHWLGKINCTFISSIIDLKIIFLAGNVNDQIYFQTPDSQKMNFTELNVGPSELFYGYFTYAIKNHYTKFVTQPDYGLFNNNIDRSSYVSYDIDYHCVSSLAQIRLIFF